MYYGRRRDDDFLNFETIKFAMFLSLVAFFMLWGAISSLFSSNVAIATNIPAEPPPQNTAGRYIRVDTPTGSTTPKQSTRAISTGNITTFL